MRIMTKQQYDAIVDIVTGQKEIIANKEAEIKKLQAQVDRLSYLLEVSLAPAKSQDKYIDFPNSQKGGFEGSNIFEL